MFDECKHIMYSRHDIAYFAFDFCPLDATYDALRRSAVTKHFIYERCTVLSTLKPREDGLLDILDKPEEEFVRAFYAGVFVVEQHILQNNGQHELQYDIFYAME